MQTNKQTNKKQHTYIHIKKMPETNKQTNKKQTNMQTFIRLTDVYIQK